MISIEQRTTLADIEATYRPLGTPEAEIIRVPTSLRFGGTFGVSAALVQLLARWSRVQTSPTLKLYGSGQDDNQLESLAQEPHGIAALYFSQRLLGVTGTRISTRIGLEYALPRIKAMQSSELRGTMAGRGVFLACFAGARNEYLLPLYSKGRADSLRGRYDFIELTKRMIEACAPLALNQFDSLQLKAISSLVYELFRNTDDHARLDENGLQYDRNIRGLLVKFISFTSEESIGEMSVGDVALTRFLIRSLLHKDKFRNVSKPAQKNPTHTPFLEITVFDTGPGLVRRWISGQLDKEPIDRLGLEAEVAIVRKCFARHTTTKDSRASGEGLDLVVQVLRELQAFLRLRTSRICLYQDFSEKGSSTFDPQHWLGKRPQLNDVAGAAYSIAIPLSRVAR